MKDLEVTIDGRTIILTAEEVEAGELKDLHVKDIARLKLAYQDMVASGKSMGEIVTALAPGFNEVEEVMSNPIAAWKSAKTRAEIMLAAMRFGPK